MKERGVKIKANFGCSAFMYDLDQHRLMMKRIEIEGHGQWKNFQCRDFEFREDEE
jgi:hypothetical protein